MAYLPVTPYTPPEWQTYSVSWTTDGSSPSVGNGSLDGSYVKTGKTVSFTIRLEFGSTTNPGTSEWHFGLPVTAASAARGTFVCPAWGTENGITYYSGTAFNLDDTDLVVVLDGQATAGASGTLPFTWDTGDVLTISGTYESDS